MDVHMAHALIPTNCDGVHGVICDGVHGVTCDGVHGVT